MGLKSLFHVRGPRVVYDKHNGGFLFQSNERKIRSAEEKISGWAVPCAQNRKSGSTVTWRARSLWTSTDLIVADFARRSIVLARRRGGELAPGLGREAIAGKLRSHVTYAGQKFFRDQQFTYLSFNYDKIEHRHACFTGDKGRLSRLWPPE